MGAKRTAIFWIFDAGAEALFPVSLYSLKHNSPQAYATAVKVVLDCGISDACKKWLGSLKDPDIFVFSVPLPEAASLVGGAGSVPAAIMRLKIELPRIAADLHAKGQLPAISQFLYCDTDTVFLAEALELFNTEWEGEQIRCALETDWAGSPETDCLELMKLMRPSTFCRDQSSVSPEDLAHAFGLEPRELFCIPTVNSGVWMARVNSVLCDHWRRAYNEVLRADTECGAPTLNPYSAEQNALSLGIFTGAIIPRYLPRRFNHLPPREPHAWPVNAVIAHFVSFNQNRDRPAFRLWFEYAERAVRSGFAPVHLLPD